MKIGIIGAGFVGRAIAKLAIKAGHEVMLSNSRDPRTLFSLKPMILSLTARLSASLALSWRSASEASSGCAQFTK